MGTTFRPYQPDQVLMLPPDLREWVSEGHLAHHVSDLVDAVDLSAFYAQYRGDGRRNSPYDPRMMVKVLIYAYATGTFSSRKMAKRLEEDVAFRMLAAGTSRSTGRCASSASAILGISGRCSPRWCCSRGLWGGRAWQGIGRRDEGRANASKRKAMSYGRMVKEEPRLEEEIRALEEEIQALVEKAEAVDEAEDERYGEDARGDELPEELKRREDRLAADPGGEGAPGSRAEGGGRRAGPQAGAEDATRRGAGPTSGSTASRTRRRRATSPIREPDHEDEFEGFQQSYNAQMVVEGENQLVVGAEVTDNASDQGQLIPMVDAAAEMCGETPAQVLADAGYCNERTCRR